MHQAFLLLLQYFKNFMSKHLKQESIFQESQKFEYSQKGENHEKTNDKKMMDEVQRRVQKTSIKS